MSVDDPGTSVLAGTEKSLLCSFVELSSEIMNITFSRWEEVLYLWDIERIRCYDDVKTNSSRVTLNVSGSSHWLQFKPIRTSDSGQYVCRTLGSDTQELYGLIHLNVTSEHE